jgi:hypothetical protein
MRGVHKLCGWSTAGRACRKLQKGAGRRSVRCDDFTTFPDDPGATAACIYAYEAESRPGRPGRPESNNDGHFLEDG